MQPRVLTIALSIYLSCLGFAHAQAEQGDIYGRIYINGPRQREGEARERFEARKGRFFAKARERGKDLPAIPGTVLGYGYPVVTEGSVSSPGVPAGTSEGCVFDSIRSLDVELPEPRLDNRGWHTAAVLVYPTPDCKLLVGDVFPRVTEMVQAAMDKVEATGEFPQATIQPIKLQKRYRGRTTVRPYGGTTGLITSHATGPAESPSSAGRPQGSCPDFICACAGVRPNTGGFVAMVLLDLFGYPETAPVAWGHWYTVLDDKITCANLLSYPYAYVLFDGPDTFDVKWELKKDAFDAWMSSRAWVGHNFYPTIKSFAEGEFRWHGYDPVFTSRVVHLWNHYSSSSFSATPLSQLIFDDARCSYSGDYPWLFGHGFQCLGSIRKR